MDVRQLPDQPQSGDKVLATIPNVEALLAKAGIRARYNEVKKKVEIDIPGLHGTSDNRDNVTLTAIVSLCAQHSMPTGPVGEYVNAIADRHAYNPVADWIGSRPWDGTDRLPELVATVHEQEGYPVHLKGALLRKWVRSAAAAATVPGYKGRGVLTFQGPQGIGKTSWVKALVSDAALRDSVVKLDHHLDGSSKDSVIGAVGNWIVEIGELDSSFRKDVARLKGFITADSDRVRRPYDRRESEYPRRTLFVATVNEASFLVDPTGNSRFWTVAVDGLDYGHSIDTQQLFAQAAAEVKAGETWWLNEHEDALLASWNERHHAASVVADRVYAVLQLDEAKVKMRRWVTPSDLLTVAGIANATNAQAKECGAILRGLFGQPSRIRGIYKWAVPLIEARGEELVITLDRAAERKLSSLETKEIF